MDLKLWFVEHREGQLSDLLEGLERGEVFCYEVASGGSVGRLSGLPVPQDIVTTRERLTNLFRLRRRSLWHIEGAIGFEKNNERGEVASQHAREDSNL